MVHTTTAPTADQAEPFPLGAHVVTPRFWYTHHGIYIGAGQVVHYCGLSSSLRRGPVERVSLAEFTQGHPVYLHGDSSEAYCGMEVVRRACSRLGEDAYDLLRNNCEHFCSWCLSGKAHSPQIDRLLSTPRALAMVAQVLIGIVNVWMNVRAALPPIN
jgi:hypothetical protein